MKQEIKGSGGSGPARKSHAISIFRSDVNCLAGLLRGISEEVGFSEGLTDRLISIDISEKSTSILATSIVVTVITFITIIFGEFVSQCIG